MAEIEDLIGFDCVVGSPRTFQQRHLAIMLRENILHKPRPASEVVSHSRNFGSRSRDCIRACKLKSGLGNCCPSPSSSFACHATLLSIVWSGEKSLAGVCSEFFSNFLVIATLFLRLTLSIFFIHFHLLLILTLRLIVTLPDLGSDPALTLHPGRPQHRHVGRVALVE